jgi:uncharacterized protein YcgI (DUF1989 family)
MLAPMVDGRSIEYQRPRCRPGDYVEMRAEMDSLMVFSACPDERLSYQRWYRHPRGRAC